MSSGTSRKKWFTGYASSPDLSQVGGDYPPLADFLAASVEETRLLSRRRCLTAMLGLAGMPLAGCGGGGSEAAPPNDPCVPGNNGGASVPADQGADIGLRTYSARWANSLVPEIGEVPVWTTGSGTGIPTVLDCWGRLRNAKLREARFWGARRVENKIRFSSDLTNASHWGSVGDASVTVLANECRAADSTGAYKAHRLSKTLTNSARFQTVGVLPAVAHTFSIYARAESLSQVYIQFYISGGGIIASGLFDLSASGWTRVQISGTPDGVSSYRVLISPGPFVSATAGSILVCDSQVEDVSGHPNLAASEYVATDRVNQPGWYYGAMVDGVRYFDTFKGNTVAAGVVKDSTGLAIPAQTLQHLRLEPADVNLCGQSESFSTWTINPGSLVLASSVAESPRGDHTATRITESDTQSNKLASLSLGAVANNSAITVSCFGKAESAKWLRLNVTLSNGASVISYFDLDNGAIGSVSSPAGRSVWAHVEPWADGWFRCVLTASNSATGASSPQMDVGIASGDGVSSYIGTGEHLLIWGAQAAPVEYASSYIQNSSMGGSTTRQSQSVEVPNNNGSVMGTQNFVVALDAFPAYYTGITIKGGVIPAWRPFWSGFASGADRNLNRLGMGLRPTTVAFFGDRYLDDPNPLYYWKANTFYPQDSVVIPLDTLANNANRRKMFICVVAGVSGPTEPTWDSTFVLTPDTVTHITNDGSVKWQNNHDNTILGQWEPYDTSVLALGLSVFPAVVVASSGIASAVAPTRAVRAAYFSAPGAYGFAVNGQSATLRTRPFPIDGSADGDLHQTVESIRLGRLAESVTSHPLGIGNFVVSREQINTETNRVRSILATP